VIANLHPFGMIWKVRINFALRHNSFKITLTRQSKQPFAISAVQEYRNVIECQELAGVVVFAIVGVVLVALASAKTACRKGICGGA
jgi:hypothetical protein